MLTRVMRVQPQFDEGVLVMRAFAEHAHDLIAHVGAQAGYVEAALLAQPIKEGEAEKAAVKDDKFLLAHQRDPPVIERLIVDLRILRVEGILRTASEQIDQHHHLAGGLKRQTAQRLTMTNEHIQSRGIRRPKSGKALLGPIRLAGL